MGQYMYEMLPCDFTVIAQSIKLQSQNSEVLRILIYTRLKINKKQIVVQVSSPAASFI